MNRAPGEKGGGARPAEEGICGLDSRPEVLYGGFVPTAPKGAVQTGAGKEQLPFEEALKKLEAIVEAMESGDLPLEAMLAKFEEGTRLVKLCHSKLEEAELKIQKLETNAAGEPTLKPLDTPSASDED